jgi:WD40 repeat protein/tetratricopeptide (TPR) repeat protein
MYHRGMKWETYRELEEFKDDLVDKGKARTQELIASQAEAARETHQTLERGFGTLVASQGQMEYVLERGFSTLAHGMQQVADGVEALHADFTWAMGALLWKLELQQETLRDILTTLQSPLSTEARELRRRAEFAYQQGWYEEALSDFLASEERNYQDFAIHQAIGNIYLYHKQPLELEKAREYYRKAGKYATPHSPYHAALGYLHAAFVCYLQQDDAAAIENAQRAVELYPKWIEAHYELAKFAAAAGRADVAVPALEKAVRTERNYAVKARADADFATIEAAVTELMQRLHAKAKRRAEAEWLPLRERIEQTALAPADHKRLAPIYEEVTALMEEDTYFSYLDAPPRITRCRTTLEQLGLSERDRLRDEAAARLSGLRSDMDDYILPDAIQRQLTTVEALFANPMTQPQAQTALQQVKHFEKEWKTAKREIRKLARIKHPEYVWALVFSPDGRLFATGSTDNKLRLWERTGRKKAVFETHREGYTDSIKTLAFSPEGKTLASGLDDHTIRLWDVKTGQETFVLRGHTRNVTMIDFSPDGETLASGSYDATIRLWDAQTGQEKALLEGHEEWIYTVAFSPKGTLLASSSRDQTVRLWDVSAGREATAQKTIEDATCMAFSPDGATLATGSMNGTIHLWDTQTGQEKGVLEGHTEMVREVAFSPDGTTLASASKDKTLRLWNMRTARTEATYRGSDEFWNIRFSPDGTRLAAKTDRHIFLWKPDQNKVCFFIGDTDGVYDIVFSPDSALLASSSKNGVHLWHCAMTRQEWEQVAQARKRREEEHMERLRLKREREEQERQARKRQEAAERERALEQSTWRATGRCEMCGAELGVLAKLTGRKRCRKHR